MRSAHGGARPSPIPVVRWFAGAALVLLFAVMQGACWGVAGAGPLVAATLEQADRLYGEAQWEQAIQLLDTAIAGAPADDPLMTRMRELLARCYLKNSQADLARDQVQMILEREPNWVPDPVFIPPTELAALQAARAEILAQRAQATAAKSPAAMGIANPPRIRPREPMSEMFRLDLRLSGVVAMATMTWPAEQSITDGYGNVYFARDNAAPQGMRAGAGLGLGVRLQMGARSPLSLGVGLCYEQKGGLSMLDVSIRDTGFTDEADFHWNLDYVTVPLVARWEPPQGVVRPYLEGGPEVAFLISSDSNLEFLSSSSSAEAILRDSFRPIDYAVTGLGGLEFCPGSGPMRVFVQMRYSYGLTDVFDSADVLYDVKVRNEVVAVDVGFGF